MSVIIGLNLDYWTLRMMQIWHWAHYKTYKKQVKQIKWHTERELESLPAVVVSDCLNVSNEILLFLLIAIHAGIHLGTTTEPSKLLHPPDLSKSLAQSCIPRMDFSGDLSHWKCFIAHLGCMWNCGWLMVLWNWLEPQTTFLLLILTVEAYLVVACLLYVNCIGIGQFNPKG